MLSYLYIPEKNVYLTYDERSGVVKSECPCSKEKVSKAGFDFKILIYILLAFLVLKLLRII